MSARVSPELIRKIKDAVNLIDVVGEHVVLRKSGSNYSGLCPFHSERSPSFSVSEQKQLYHCYGCKKGGDLVSFVMEIHGIPFAEAIDELAERGKVALPAGWAGSDLQDPEARKRKEAANEKQALAYKLTRFAAAFYHQQLARLTPAREYLSKRGLGADGPGGELRRTFYLGAAPAGWDALARHLQQAKAPLALAAEIGLIRPSQKASPVPGGTGYFDLFRNRAMFPILDMRGRVAGFGGRALPSPEGEADDGPKYLNSSESQIFQKSRLAFGLFQAQKHVREKDEIVLVEGYFDVLALHAGGFANSVATCGTALTPDHLQLFKRFGQKVTVLFDGDKAGISATERAMEIGLEHGQILYGASLPEGLDPDEVLFDAETGRPLPKGRENMAAILASAVPLLDARIDEAVQAAQAGPEARAQALKRVGRWLAMYRDPVGREVRVQAVAERLSVPRTLVAQAMGAPASAPSRPAAATVVARPPAQRGAGVKMSGSDRLLLSAWFGGAPEFAASFAEVGAKLPPGSHLPDLWESPSARVFVAAVIVLGGPSHAHEALGPETDPAVRSLVSSAVLGGVTVEGLSRLSVEEVRTALDRSIARVWARFSQGIKVAIAHAEANKDAGLQSQLMKEYLDVQRKMKEFNCFYDEAP